MSARVAWLYRDRIVHQQMYGTLTTDDVTYITETTQPMMAAGTPPVHTLVDAKFLLKFPTNLATLKRAVSSPASSNLGWVIMINNGNPILRFVGAAIAQVAISNVRFRIFDTYDEGLRLLAAMDSTLGEEVLSLTIPAPPSEVSSG